jgi:hypothetical protein
MSQQILVTPYIQPGNAPSLNKEEKVIIWQTDNIAARFNVEYGTDNNYGHFVKVKTTSVILDGSNTILYRAVLKNLLFDQQYYYRISLNGTLVAKSQFATRSKKPASRFVVLGDCGAGSAAEAQIAYQAYLKQPDFVLITGDNVYSRGRISEYLKNYFPYFNSSDSSPFIGAPLMRSVPFYLAIGNHDVGAMDLATYADGLAFYYYFDLPLNAPAFNRTVTPTGSNSQVRAFKKAVKPRFPNMANYSFDHGNVHIVCIDANPYVFPFDPELVRWIEADLKSSTATWKIAAFHHPGFNSSIAHYDAQWMRILAPVFERSGVDIVLNGHVHNYQRTHPLKFKPKADIGGNVSIDSNGRVDGTFALDREYDGKMKTRPNGIIYLVTGAGGAGLYDTLISNKPETWRHEPAENWVPFTAKLISHVHSFSTIETDNNLLTFRQIDGTGNLLDEIQVTK